MYRLYGINLLDNNIWKIKSNKNTYKLINTKTKDVYYFKDIIGLEQINKDEFIVLKDIGNMYEVTRLKLDNESKYVTYKHTFNKYIFITDDYILFIKYGNNGKLVFDGVYSISKNKDLEESRWLYQKGVDVKTIDDTKVLLFEQKIYGSTNDSIIFCVDIDTFLPNGLCYSTLRDSYIKVDSKEDIKKFSIEDSYYKEIIDNITIQESKEILSKAKGKILKRSSR